MPTALRASAAAAAAPCTRRPRLNGSLTRRTFKTTPCQRQWVCCAQQEQDAEAPAAAVAAAALLCIDGLTRPIDCLAVAQDTTSCVQRMLAAAGPSADPQLGTQRQLLLLLMLPLPVFQQHAVIATALHS